MNSRLHRIQNWQELARQTHWCIVLLAKYCKVSVRTLERYFLEAKGECPHQWLFEDRMLRAVELLRDGSSVKETAAALGYKHPTHFSREFKKRWGRPPSAHLKISRLKSESARVAATPRRKKVLATPRRQ